MVMNKINTIYAEEAVINDTKKPVKYLSFKTLVLVFLVGALMFAVSLSYNNFAQAIISSYSFGGDGIKATFINLILFTALALTILYMAWRYNPEAVGSAIA